MIKCETCEKYDQLVPGLIRLIIINRWGLIFEGSSYPRFNIIEKGPTNVDPFSIGGEGGIRTLAGVAPTNDLANRPLRPTWVLLQWRRDWDSNPG